MWMKKGLFQAIKKRSLSYASKSDQNQRLFADFRPGITQANGAVKHQALC